MKIDVTIDHEPLIEGFEKLKGMLPETLTDSDIVSLGLSTLCTFCAVKGDSTMFLTVNQGEYSPIWVKKGDKLRLAVTDSGE